jgi:hypothetical protein
MKVAQQAFILAISTSTLVHAHTFRKHVDASKFDIRSLMEHATQSSPMTDRKLQNSDLHAGQNILFRSCQTLSLETNSNSGTVQSLVASGTAIGVQSYVEFDLCSSQNCFSGEEGSRVTYVVPLSDYIQAFSQFLPTKQEEYCQGCIDNNDYCGIEYYPNTNVEVTSTSYYSSGDDSGRRLQQNGEVYEAIDCDLCRAYNCLYTDNEEYNDRMSWTQENSMAWIQKMASCYRNEYRAVYISDTQASFSFMCNADGNGVEIGVFLDEDCTIYDSKVHFGDVMSQSDYYFFTQSKANVEYIFDNSFSCFNPEITYVNPDKYEELAANQGENESDEFVEAAEWCQSVFQGSAQPMDFTSCSSTSLDDWATVDSGSGTALSQNDLKDMTTACSYLAAHSGSGQGIYNKKGSGSMYSYTGTSTPYSTAEDSTGEDDGDESSSVSSSSTANNNWKSTLSKMSEETALNAGKIAKAGTRLGVPGIVGIVLASIAVGFAVPYMVYRNMKKNRAGISSNEEPMLSKEGDLA